MQFNDITVGMPTRHCRVGYQWLGIVEWLSMTHRWQWMSIIWIRFCDRIFLVHRAIKIRMDLSLRSSVLQLQILLPLRSEWSSLIVKRIIDLYYLNLVIFRWYVQKVGILYQIFSRRAKMQFFTLKRKCNFLPWSKNSVFYQFLGRKIVLYFLLAGALWFVGIFHSRKSSDWFFWDF